MQAGADNATNFSQCDSLLIGKIVEDTCSLY